MHDVAATVDALKVVARNHRLERRERWLPKGINDEKTDEAEETYFGTDGIRGEVGEFPITPDSSFQARLGRCRSCAGGGQRGIVTF